MPARPSAGRSETADALRDAVFHAAYDLDPGRGTSRVLFGLFGKGAGRDERPRPSPYDVAHLLDSVPLDVERDVVVTAPPVGLASTTRSMRGRGAVGLWLVEDGLGWDSARVERVHVPRDARIHEIDGPDAWAELCRRYPLEVTASRRHDWYRTTGRDGRWVIPDWLRVRHDFDAIHLSVGGYLATAGSAIFVEDDRATVLAGWDPDKTYWLRDVTRDSSTGQGWRYDGTAETWQLSNPVLRRWAGHGRRARFRRGAPRMPSHP